MAAIPIEILLRDKLKKLGLPVFPVRKKMMDALLIVLESQDYVIKAEGQDVALVTDGQPTVLLECACEVGSTIATNVEEGKMSFSRIVCNAVAVAESKYKLGSIQARVVSNFLKMFHGDGKGIEKIFERRNRMSASLARQ